MTPLRFSLGSLWLTIGLGIFLYPVGYLWQARNYLPRRAGAHFGRFAVLCDLRALCWGGATIAVGLGGVWREFASRCTGLALTLFLLGLWLVRFEAPIDGLYDADDDEVLDNEEMLSLWYGGLNTKYIRHLEDLYHSNFFSRGRLEVLFPRTRAWAWDSPRLRAFAYYIKGQNVMFLGMLLMMGVVGNMLGRLDGTRELDVSFQGAAVPNLYVHIPMTIFVGIVFFTFAWPIRREWMAHYRALTEAMKEGRDPDLSDRARLAEMRRTILSWGQEKGYVRYDREERCWKPNEGAVSPE